MGKKRIALIHFPWFVLIFALNTYQNDFIFSNLPFRLFRILLILAVFLIFLRIIIKEFKYPLFSINSNKFLNFTITFSNVQKDYLMEEPFIEPCKGKQIKLLVLIMSRRETFYKRMGIRKSWAKDGVN